jgi:hypothetical protein
VLGVSGEGVQGGDAVGVAFEGTADDVAEAHADGKGEGENDAAEEDAEGEIDHSAPDLEVVEDHGGGEDLDEPFNAKGEEAGVLELGIDGADEHGSREETGDDVSEDEKDDSPDGVGEVGDQEEGDLRVVCVRGVEGGDADEAANDDEGPEDRSADQQRRAMRGRPVGDGRDGVVGEALVEFNGGEDTAEKCCEKGSEGSKDDDREEQRKEAGKKTGELEEHAMCGLGESEFDLLPHRAGLLRWAGGYGLKRSGQRQRDTR